MKKMAAALLLFSCGVAFAQDKPVKVDLPIECYKKEVVLKELTEKFDETIIFAGIEETQEIKGISSFLFWNSKTDTYTFIFHLTKGDMVCIVSAGSGNIVLPNKNGV